MSIEQIDGLAQAIYDQCGMRTTLSESFSEFGLEVVVQVRLVPESVEVPQYDDWQFFRAKGEEQLTRLRDELADFIAENRKEQAA